jgi:hypothetical protein
MRLVLALCLCGCAAHAPVNAASGPPPPQASGLVVARLDGELSTQHCERTRFTARVVAPPARRGEPVTGRVIRCDAGYGPTPARLDLRVDAPAHARVTSAPIEPLGKSPDSQPIRNGAVGGAVVGAVLMGIPGAWLGYSVGGGGGIVKEVANQRNQARIPAGALLTLRIN